MSYQIGALARLPEDNRALLVFGGAKCCCATADCRLCFRARQPNRLREGSQLDQGTAVPTGQRASGGQVVNFPTGAGRQTAPNFAEVISVSPCLTANALAENRSPVSPPYRRKLVRREAASFLRDFRPASGGGRAFFLMRQASRGPPSQFDRSGVRSMTWRSESFPGHHTIVDQTNPDR